jgi:outer membrane protein OmpU
MKNLLFGTTALVAAGLAAGPASAASALKLGITGFFRNAIGTSWGSEPSAVGPAPVGFSTAGLANFDRQDVSMRQEIRINFTGQTTLDNGITVGVLVGLNGENVAKSGSTNQINRAYADFSGKFGMIRIGEANSALVTDCVTDPGNVTSNFGVNSPNESFSNVGLGIRRNFFTSSVAAGTVGVAPVGSMGTCYGIESKGNKIMYFSPSFDGFTFGVSFTPQGSSRLAGGGYAYGTMAQTASTIAGPGDNILSVAADYQHDFGDWNLTVGGGGEWAFTHYTTGGGSASNKPAWYQLGAQVGIGHWTFGASGAYYADYAAAGYAATTAFSGDNGWVATAGFNYTVGTVGVGVQGMYSQWGQFGGAVNDETLWGVSLNATYAYGPGINLDAQLSYTSADYGGAVVAPFIFGLPSVHSLELDFGTAINF